MMCTAQVLCNVQASNTYSKRMRRFQFKLCEIFIVASRVWVLWRAVCARQPSFELPALSAKNQCCARSLDDRKLYFANQCSIVI